MDARDVVAIGTATDPYQPIEGHYKLTRRSLEALLAARTPVGIVTKGPMVVRDIDLLVRARAASRGCTVCISVPTVHEEAWAALEPGTAHPLQRLRAVRQLREAGVNAGVLMAPVVPGFTTQPARLEATIKAIADHGAAFMGANIMYLKGGTRDHFMHFIAQEFPRSARRLSSGCIRARTRRADYVETVRGLIDTLRERYDVARRDAMRVAPSDRRRAEDVEPSRRTPSRRRSSGARRGSGASARLRRRRELEGAAARDDVDLRPGRRPPSATKSRPSVQRWLIGSLMRSSITRLRNRAPNARL